MSMTKNISRRKRPCLINNKETERRLKWWSAHGCNPDLSRRIRMTKRQPRRWWLMAMPSTHSLATRARARPLTNTHTQNHNIRTTLIKKKKLPAHENWSAQKQGACSLVAQKPQIASASRTNMVMEKLSCTRWFSTRCVFKLFFTQIAQLNKFKIFFTQNMMLMNT